MSFLKCLVLSVYNPVVIFYRKRVLKVSHQRNFSERTEEKWSLIRPELPETPGSLLDIGCAEGHFTREAAKLGWSAWGVDGQEQAIVYARKRAHSDNVENVFFSQGLISSAVAKHLPGFDVVLFLSSYHQISKNLGDSGAREFLHHVLSACRQKVIFEPASVNRKYGESLLDKDNDWHSMVSWVEGLLPEGWSARSIGGINYTSEEPVRWVFVLERRPQT